MFKEKFSGSHLQNNMMVIPLKTIMVIMLGIAFFVYTLSFSPLQGYRVIEEPVPEGSEGEKVMFERQRAWCCSTTPEPALCGISRIWVFSLMRRRGIASRMIECLR